MYDNPFILFLSLIVWTFLIIFVVRKLRNRDKTVKVKKFDVGYEYKIKEHLMTRSEQSLYSVLLTFFGNDYDIFPQMQLSSILNHKVYNQNWKGAFGRISQKSVDYIICDKINMRPLVAIELDDSTHDYPDRQQRDALVNAIFEQVNLPLVHFRNVTNLTSEDIKEKIQTFLSKNEVLSPEPNTTI